MLRTIKQEDYKFKTKPFDHQQEVFDISRDKENFALFMEQGTGKTKVIIDNAGYLYQNGKIDLVVVMAPNGVHRNWMDEVDKHLPEHIPHVKRFWDSQKSGTKKFQRWLDEVHQEGVMLRFVFMNIEALTSEKANKKLLSILQGYNVFFVIDESHYIKNWGSGRSKKLFKLRHEVKYRRIMTGTPYTNQPADLFGQFRFLDEEIIGHSSFYTFQARYCELIEDPGTLVGLSQHQVREVMLLRKVRETPKGRFAQLVSKNADGTTKYQRIEELVELIAPHSFRVTKAECLDLPPKLYQTIYMDMSKEQRKYYETLRDELLVEVDGGELTAAMAMVRMLRLQQILGGFLPLDDGRIVELDCPRMRRTIELVKGFPGKTIVWARFTKEVEKLYTSFGDSAVMYNGEMSGDQKAAAVKRFKEDPSCHQFVGNQAAGSTGLDLWCAENMFYYSNTFRLDHRLQSEDRFHRIGQTKSVTIYDAIVPDTMDAKIVGALREKHDVANQITGDKVKKWL